MKERKGRGMGGGGKVPSARTPKTAATVIHHQNNIYVKVVGISPVRYMKQVMYQLVLSTAVRNKSQSPDNQLLV